MTGYADGSYGINEAVSNATPLTTNLQPNEWWRTTNVRGADNIPVILDSIWLGGYQKSRNQRPPDHPDVVGQAVLYNYIQLHCRDRHSGHINSLFMDSSARKVGLKQLWTFEWCRGDNYTTNPYVISAYGSGPAARALYAAKWDGLPIAGGAPWMKNMKEY